MPLKITHKYSTVTGTPPASGDIDVGELAINGADAELYVKDNAGNIRKFQNTTTGTSDGVQFTQSGTGAVQRTVESKLQDVVSVKDFGAVGDEVTDDTAAIQAAFDHAAQTGKAVYFPAGKYLVSQIAVSKSVSFFGDGRTNTRIRSSNDTLNLFTYEMAYSAIHPFFIRDLTFFGGKYQLLTHNARDVDIRNCGFLRPTEAGIRGGWNAYHWTVEGCEFKGGRYNIMFFGTGTTDTLNENPPSNATGISGQLNSLIGNWYVEAEQAAIRLNTAEGLNIIGGYLELCASDDSGGNSAWSASTSFAVGDVANIKSGTANGYVYRCTSAGTTGASAPTNTTEGASVVDGTVTWEVLGRRAGVLVTNNRGFRMTHMQGERNQGTPWVVLNGTSTYYYATIIANNSIRQTYPAPGIEINNENRVIITGNHFIDNGAWFSIPSGSTVKGLIATGNIFQNDKSVLGTLEDYDLHSNIQQSASDVFTPAATYTDANTFTSGYSQAADRFIEAQFLGNPDTTYTKTYTLAATFDASTKGYVGTYEVQVGQYVSGASTYGLSTYELNVTKGPNGINTTFTKISGNLNATLTATTNTATAYTGQIQVGAGEGALIRVIRKTPLTGRANLTTLTHTIA